MGFNGNQDLDKVEFKRLTFHLENKRLEISRDKGRIIPKLEFYEMVAKEIGMTREGIQQIKKGYAFPSLIRALRLSNYLNVTVNELFYLKKEESDRNENKSIGFDKNKNKRK